jgi:alpha-glucosidase
MPTDTLQLIHGPTGVALAGAPLPIAIEAVAPEVIRLSFGDEAASAPSYLPLRPAADSTLLRATSTLLSTEHLTLGLDSARQHLRLADRSDATQLQIELGTIEQEPRWRIRFINAGEHHFYGLGQGGLPLDRLGTTRRLWNSHINHGPAGDIPIPLMLSHRGFGLFFDNPRYASIDSGKSHNHICFDYECDPGAFDLYYVGGASLREVLSNATALLGRPPLPPRWSLGYLQSSRHFESADEVMSLGRTLREKKLPADGVIFLSTYKDGKGWNEAVGRLDYDPTVFPSGSKMVREMRADNLQVITHEYPVIHPGAPQFKESQDKSFTIADGYPVVVPTSRPSTSFFEGQRMLDFENPAAGRWWWEQHKDLVDDGVGGWWLDGGEGPTEPAVLNRPGGNALHNRFDLFRQQAFAEGEARDNPNRRPYLLCRSGGAGMQRFGAGVWSGDINNTWTVFEAQPALGLNIGLSGVPLWGTDIGGFYPTVTPQSGELFARWFQFGAFNPVFRSHGVVWRNHAPWSYGDEIEAICRAALELRYRLTPYTYTLAWQAHTTGLPYMRALALNYPDDPEARDRSAEFLWGDDILVAPVTRNGARQWPVYLPRGTAWYDYWTGARHDGGGWVVADAPLDRMPIFIRAGAIIPLGPDVQHFTGYAPEEITLLAYRGESSSFTLYEDDGQTNAYRAGAFAKTTFTRSLGTFSVSASEGDATVVPSARRYTLRLRSDDDPRAIRREGGSLPWHRDGAFIVVDLGSGPSEIQIDW